MKLKEVANQAQQSPPLDKTKKWLDSYHIEKYTIRPDGIVDVGTHVRFHGGDFPHFPVQFGNIQGDFSCSTATITSLQGAPLYVKGDFSCMGCPNLTSMVGSPRRVDGSANFVDSPVVSLEGVPEHIGKQLGLHDTSIYNLHGIDKLVKYMRFFSCNDGTSQVLGLLLINGLIRVQVGPKAVDDILTKYLGTGDILSAQDELIDAGLKAQAKL